MSGLSQAKEIEGQSGKPITRTVWRRNESTGRWYPKGLMRIHTGQPPGIDELPPPDVDGPLSTEPPPAVIPEQLKASGIKFWRAGIELSQPRGDRDDEDSEM